MSSRMTVFAFLIFLTIPACGLLFPRSNDLLTQEQRKLYEFHSSRIEELPGQFELYARDRVTYRQDLLQIHQSLNTRVFDTPVTSSVWIGRDDWLFLNVSDPQLGRVNAISINDRIERKVEEFKHSHRWLQEQGIEYVVVIVPEKSAVYPEYLRGFPKRHPPPEPAELCVKLLKSSGIKAVNALPPLLSAKRDDTWLYGKYDTHWTHDGAWIAYAEVARELNFTPTPIHEYQAVSIQKTGDLCHLAGWPESRGTETVLIRMPPSILKPEQSSVFFLHDSFGEVWFSYLPSDFKSFRSEKTLSFPTEKILSFKPKIVIQEIAARHLYTETNSR